METWWPVEQSYWFGVVGGGAGCLLGIGGAVVGAFLVPRALGRRWVVSGMVGIAAAGGMSMVVGGLAIADDQPYAIYNPLLLLGCVLYLVTIGMLLPVDIAFRVATTMRNAGLEPAALRGEVGGRIASGAFAGTWRKRERSRRWMVRLMWCHAGFGGVALCWGIGHYLTGGLFHGRFLGVLLGAVFIASAGQYWWMDFAVMRGQRSMADPQWLAAEELRRS